MANRVSINQKLGNKNISSGSSLIKTSLVTEEDIEISKKEIEKEETTQEEQQKNTITTTSSKIDDINFTSTIRKMRYELENEEDLQKLSYDIDVIVLETINNVQTKYERDDEGKIEERKYIDQVVNNTLLVETFNEVKKLVLRTNMTKDEMNSYFSEIIDKCILGRFDFIVNLGIDNFYSPKEIERLLKGFVDVDILDENVVNSYITESMNYAYEILYNRVDRLTFLTTELNNEILRIIADEKHISLSDVINDCINKSVEEKYVKLAKINIDDRTPRCKMLMKKIKNKYKNRLV